MYSNTYLKAEVFSSPQYGLYSRLPQLLLISKLWTRKIRVDRHMYQSGWHQKKCISMTC